MKGFLFKWLLIPVACLSLGARSAEHPIYVSVTEIEHNAKDRALEISCKIFTDDFEKTLRSTYNAHVDLLDENIKPAMDKLVSDYVTHHLKISADGRSLVLNYIGYERIDEGIYSYYRVADIAAVKKITVSDDVLFSYSDQQINIVHVIVGGERKSTKLENPDKVAVFEF